MNEERLKEIRELHQPIQGTIVKLVCTLDHDRYPCEVIQLANAYESLQRERDELWTVAVELEKAREVRATS